MSKIYAVASIYDTPELLPHFLDHYTRLGVTEILISSNIPLVDQKLLERRFSVRFFHTNDPRFDDLNRSANEERMLIEVGANSDDWVLHLDLDEFHQYAQALPDLVDLLEQRGINAVAGRFIDRVAEDGILRQIKPFPSLAAQYPLCGRLTEIINHGLMRKIMIAHRHVKLGAGRHSTADGTKWDGPNSKISGANYVHHFRWTNGLVERLEAQFSSRRNVQPYKAQFCQDYRKRGRINLGNRRLRIRPAGEMVYRPSKLLLEKLRLIDDSRSNVSVADMVALTEIIHSLRPRRVLEFGPGRSTFLWLTLGCRVDIVDAGQLLGGLSFFANLAGVRVHTSLNSIQRLGCDQRFDLAFISRTSFSSDSPSRALCVEAALSCCNTVLLHQNDETDQADLLQRLASREYRIETFPTPHPILIIQKLQCGPAHSLLPEGIVERKMSALVVDHANIKIISTDCQTLDEEWDFGRSAVNQVLHPRYSAKDWLLIPAHSPSEVTVEIAVPATIVGFLSASDHLAPAHPVEFSVDHNSLGFASSPCESTHELVVNSGLHRLKVTHLSSENSGRYSTWAIKFSSGE